MAIQSDSKIVVERDRLVPFLMARYNADGSLDATFGSGGKVATSFGVAGGWAGDPGRRPEFSGPASAYAHE